MMTTTGPLKGGAHVILDENGICIATVKGDGTDPDRAARLAQLFAQAPQLVDVLLYLRHQLAADDDGTRYQGELQKIDHALRAAGPYATTSLAAGEATTAQRTESVPPPKPPPQPRAAPAATPQPPVRRVADFLKLPPPAPPPSLDDVPAGDDLCAGESA